MSLLALQLEEQTSSVTLRIPEAVFGAKAPNASALVPLLVMVLTSVRVRDSGLSAGFQRIPTGRSGAASRS